MVMYFLSRLLVQLIGQFSLQMNNILRDLSRSMFSRCIDKVIVFRLILL